jgi:hypothetical protein
MNGQPKKTSPWVWVGVGCLGAVALAVAFFAALGYFGYRKVKQLETELKDPQARAAKVQKILGTTHLPEGYYAVVGMSVPFVMDMAMLSDVEPDFNNPQQRQRSGLGQRGFIYIRTLSAGNDKQQLRDYFEGRSDDADVLRRNNIHIDRRGEVLKRGVIDMPEDLKLMYVSQRGEMEMAAAHTRGITTMMLLDCPRDTRQRFGIWFGPDPGAAAGKSGAAENEAARVDLTGTPADETAIREFMDHFRVCGS